MLVNGIRAHRASSCRHELSVAGPALRRAWGRQAPALLRHFSTAQRGATIGRALVDMAPQTTSSFKFVCPICMQTEFELTSLPSK